MRNQILASSVATFLLLSAAAAPRLCAQDAPRGATQWTRTTQAPPDKAIFAALDLPTPTRLRTASGAPGPDYWQQQVDYSIDVELLPEQRLVRAKEHVTYHNNSPEQLDYLWVHLEQNILRPDSISSQVDGRSLMGGASEPSDGVVLGEVSSNGAALKYTVYDTLMRVDLPAPLAARSKFEFDVAWEFFVPKRVFRRYGTLDVKKGTIWEIAQWFPAVAVYDDVHGWNTLPYIGGGEFYTNYGSYDVRIKVPHDHVVVATGELKNPHEVYTVEQQRRIAQARTSTETVIVIGRDEVGTPASRPAGDGPLVWTYHADNVRTFAWAASQAFILDAAQLGSTLCQSAYHEQVERSWSKSTQMLRAAIGGYSKRWFPYPYPMATNVAGVEGGMEYPMIVFCRANDEGSLWGVTTHEIGHTWFPMIVNSDERRHAWMDEGFNTFINVYSDEDWTGREPEHETGRIGRMMGRGGVAIDTPADQLTGGALGMLQYQKTGTGLELLREVILGPERFDYAFRTYVRRWVWKSPRPADFFRTMEDAAGMDLAWFWRGWFLEGARLDQAVDSVEQATDERGARITFTNLDRMVMPLRFAVTYADDSVENFELPVQIWFSSNRVVKRLPAGKQVKSVVVDPGQVMPDSARANNTWNG